MATQSRLAHEHRQKQVSTRHAVGGTEQLGSGAAPAALAGGLPGRPGTPLPGPTGESPCVMVL